MKHRSLDDYRALIEEGRILAEDPHGPKVYALGDGRMLKLFRAKRLLSAAHLRPYAMRFSCNAAKLERIGIPTIKVEDAFRVRELKRDVVLYRPLAGRTLREVQAEEAVGFQALESFAGLLSRLHAEGVLFRSIHFGNVIVDGSTLGLIDVADMRWRLFGALSLRQRARNFRHLTRYAEDRTALRRFGLERFVDRYAKASGLVPSKAFLLDALTRACAEAP